jgi:flagellar hook-associated protein 1
MSLAQALTAAIDGLQVTQSGMALVAANVANSATPGYTEKTQTVGAVTSGGGNVGVDVTSVNRQLNTFLQSQLRTESSGGAYADLTSQIYQQLQSAYGNPSSSSSLSATYSGFTGALQTLQSAPADYSNQTAVLDAGQALAGQLNNLTAGVQQLRTSCEQGLSGSVTNANTLLQNIATINTEVAGTPTQDASSEALLDQRDQDINQLANLMDVTVVPGSNNQVTVYTTSGVQLVGTTASQLSFNSHGSLSANALWNVNPAISGAGTITLTSPDGASTDLVATHAIKAGQIGAYLQMRDQVLPQAQAQLDQIAASVSSALSDYQTTGTPATAGGQTGYSIDVGNLSSGNTVTVKYTLNGSPKTLTIEQVSDPSSLPLPSSDPNSPVIGVDFSNMGNALQTLNGILGSRLRFTNPSGTTLDVLNGGAGTGITINSATSTATQTNLAGGTSEMPFFTDGNSPYTGAITGGMSQTLGYAGRIVVNASLLANANGLVASQAGTSSGDPTRPTFLASQLTSANLTFNPRTGIGTAAQPYTGTLSAYIGQVLSTQGAAASSAQNLSQSQDVVVNSLQQSFNTASGVNVDNEMANLLSLQNAYAANARVLTTVNQLFTTLLQAVA